MLPLMPQDSSLLSYDSYDQDCDYTKLNTSILNYSQYDWKVCHYNHKASTKGYAEFEHVLRDLNTFLRLHTFDLVWSKQQVLV